MAKRKTLQVLVTLTVPVGRSAAWARKEARYLINEGVGYYCNAGDEDGVKARSVKAVSK